MTDAAPSYHDLHITTSEIERTSIFNLPYDLEVHCTRVGGWQLWRTHAAPFQDRARCIAGEYEGPERWLVLDVDGHVILDSRRESVVR